MDNFNLKQYLTEGTLLKEDIVDQYHSYLMKIGGKEIAGTPDQHRQGVKNLDGDFNKYLQNEIDYFDLFGNEEMVTAIEKFIKNMGSNSVNEVEGSNPVFDEFMKIRNSIDSETIYTTDLVDFIKDLDNTDRENLQRDVERWYIDLVKGKYGDHKDYKDWEMDFIDAFSFEDFADVLHSDQMIFDDFEDYVNNI